MRPLRPTGDVSELPTIVFGSRSLMWWATLGYMVVEGWTLALLVASYLYFRQNYTTWPPPRTPYPSLLIPTINLGVNVVSLVPAYMAQKAAQRLDAGAVKRWLVVLSVLVVAIIVIRWWELWALNTRWDSNAYGSAAWTIVGFHTTLLLLDVADTLGLTLFYLVRPMPAAVLSDASDNSFYWYFTVGIWIPVYLIVYVGPRIF